MYRIPNLVLISSIVVIHCIRHSSALRDNYTEASNPRAIRDPRAEQKKCPQQLVEMKGLFLARFSTDVNRWTILDKYYNPVLLNITYNSKNKQALPSIEGQFNRPFTADSSYAYFDDYAHYRTYRIIDELSDESRVPRMYAVTSNSKDYLYGQFDSEQRPTNKRMSIMKKVMTTRTHHHSGKFTYFLDDVIYHACIVFYTDSIDLETAWLWYWAKPWFSFDHMRLTNLGPMITEKDQVDRKVFDWDEWVTRKLETVPFYMVPLGRNPKETPLHFFIYRYSEYSVEDPFTENNFNLLGSPSQFTSRKRIKIYENGVESGTIVDIIFLQLERSKSGVGGDYYIVDSGFSVYKLQVEGNVDLPAQLELRAIKSDTATRHQYILEQVRYYDGWQAFSDHPNSLFYTGHRNLDSDLEKTKYDIEIKVRKIDLYIPEFVDHNVLESPQYTLLSGYIFDYGRIGRNCLYYYFTSALNQGNVELKFCDNAPTHLMSLSSFHALFDYWPYYIVPLKNNMGISFLGGDKKGEFIIAKITDIVRMTPNYTSLVPQKLKIIYGPGDCNYLLNETMIKSGGQSLRKEIKLQRVVKYHRRSSPIIGRAKTFWTKLSAWLTGAAVMKIESSYFSSIQLVTLCIYLILKAMLN